MPSPYSYQSPDTRLRNIKYAREQEEQRKARIQEQSTIRRDDIRQNMEREQTRRTTLQENEARRFGDTTQRIDEQRQRKADREARQAGMEQFREVEQRQQPGRVRPAFTPTPARPGITRGELYAEGRRPLAPGERVVSPPQEPRRGLLSRGLGAVEGIARGGLDVLTGAAEDVAGPVGQFIRPPSEIVTEAYSAIPRALGQDRPTPAQRGFAAQADVAVPPGPFESMIGPTALDAIEREFGPNVRREVEFLTSPTGALAAAVFPVETAAGAGAGIALSEAARELGASNEAQMALQMYGNVVAGGGALTAKTFKGAARVPPVGPEDVTRVTPELPRVGPEDVPALGRPLGPRTVGGGTQVRGVDELGREYTGLLRQDVREGDLIAHINTPDGGVRPIRIKGMEIIGERKPVFQEPVPQIGPEDPHVARADPGPPRKPPPGEPPSRAPTPDDPEFDDIQKVAIGGEQPEQALVRRHQGAIDTAKRDAAIEVREINQMLVDAGLGRTFRQSVVAREEGSFDELNSLLHNPSRVASGELVVPDELRPIYDRLRAGTDWEQAARVDFDPDMALVEDYFFRGWQPPEGMFTGEARGALGRSPEFRLPRVNATYDEMVAAGFKPLFENPAEQMRYSRMMGVRYREQMAFIEQIKASELALPDIGGAVPDGYRVPRVGPAFEGKPYATGFQDQVAFTRRWAVKDSLANRLENAYGKTPSLGKGEIFGRPVNFQAAVDAAVFLPKRAKLIGSVFQHVDFLGRSHVGAWTGFIDSLRRGHPIESVYHLLKWPQSAVDIVHATFSPGFRAKLAKLAVDDTPLFEGRRLSNRMISEAGLSLRDETILPELDQVIRQVEAEGRLAGWGKAPARLLGDLERAWRRGLFEGVYPAAILTDVKNNIAPAIVRQHPGATDQQLAGMIAKAANTSYSTIPAAQSVVQNQQARWFLTRFLFSMGENEGLLRAFTGAIRGENAAYFRTRLLGTYLGVMTLANTIHFASTGEPLPFARWSPISKDKWGPLPVGYNRDFAAPTIPLTGRSGTEITLDLMGQMDTAFRVLNPLSFLNARVSVPARAGLTQVTGKDFFGAPIDTVGPGGIFSRAAQLAQDLFAPIGPGQAGLEALRSNIEETEGLIQPGEDRLGTAGIGVQATGVNLRAETTPQLLDRIRGDVMREMGIEGTYEEIKAVDSPLANEIDDEVEVRIGRELELRRETAELRGQTTLQGQGFQAVEATRETQQAEQLSADANLNSGQWVGDVWRDDFADRQRALYNRREQIKQDFQMEFEDKEAPSKSVNAAINAYFDVNLDDYVQPDGTKDWDGFFSAQDKALKPLSGADKARVMKFIRKYDTPTVKEFRKAQGVVDEFYDKPKYEGLSVEEGERLDEFLYSSVEEFQRRRLRESGRVLDTRRAILMAADAVGLPEKLLDVAMRLRHERWRRRLVNPERDEWLIRNENILAKFYPDLLERELSREQEIGLGEQAFEAIAAR